MINICKKTKGKMGKTVLKYKFFYRELESKTSSETEKHNV
jgi:hypothetical protein